MSALAVDFEVTRPLVARHFKDFRGHDSASTALPAVDPWNGDRKVLLPVRTDVCALAACALQAVESWCWQ